MQVQKVSFGARYIDEVKIRKVNGAQIDEYKASLVELDPKSEKDNFCIQDMIYYWGGFESYTSDIARNMGQVLCELNDVRMPIPRVFAITEQKDNYDKLRAEKILSIAETTDLKETVVNIDFLETHRDQASGAKNPKYIHLGTTMINCIKSMFKGKTLELYSTNDALGFYLKNGFELKSSNFNKCIFKG